MDDDVSHLPSFSLRPCTRLLPQIPNPNPPLHLRPLFQDPPAPFRPRCTAAPRPTPTQELRRVVENGDEEDHDFAADSWLRALEFGGGGSRTPLGSIKKGLDTLRVAKVISKDSGLLATKEFPISPVNTPAPISAESSKTLRMAQETSLPAQSTQRIMKYLRQNTNVTGSENTEKHMEAGHTAPGRILSGHAHSASQYAAVEMEPSLVEMAIPNGINKMSVREDVIDSEHLTGVAEELRMAEEDNSSSISQCISGSANSTEIPDNHGRITGAKRPRQPLSLTTALPDYTEEQLNQFDFD